MAYTAHTLVIVGGTLLESASQPEEIWQFGVRCTGVADDAAYLAALGGDNGANPGTIRQWWGTAANGMSSSAQLEFVKVAHVTPTTQEPALTHRYADPIAGPNQAFLPNFCCVAITLEAADPKSVGGRGRIYPPNGYQFVGSTISAVSVGQAAAAGVSLMDALTGGGTINAQPVVASRKYGSLEPIVACSADAIIDTQRRRRNQLTQFRQRATV